LKFQDNIIDYKGSDSGPGISLPLIFPSLSCIILTEISAEGFQSVTKLIVLDQFNKLPKTQKFFLKGNSIKCRLRKSISGLFRHLSANKAALTHKAYHYFEHKILIYYFKATEWQLNRLKPNASSHFQKEHSL